MKKLLIIITALASTVFLITACKKTGGNINPLSSVTNNGIGSYLVLDQTNNLNLDYTSITTSSVGIDVHYYPGGQAVDHVILYVSLSSSFDTTQWHAIKSIPYTSPKTTLSVTGAEIATALGVDPASLTPGSSYNIFTRAVTKNGETYDASNTGDNSGGGLITGIAYNSAFSFIATIVCPYDASIAPGNYKVIQDDWTTNAVGVDDIGVIVNVKTIGSDSLDISAVWLGPNIPGSNIVNHLVIGIDKATGTATVPKTDFGYYPPAIGDFTATAASGSGYVFACTGVITLTIDVIAGGFGDQGNFALVLQKQ
jgi:hypothetical protein